jgi:ribosomal-protein-alanine N-acetyltransferase
MARQTGAGESTVVRLLLIAELGGDLAGFLVASAPAAGSVEIESVLVAEELRRRGVGRALCRAVIDWASELGVEAVDLEVRASSGAGQLYRVMGFVAVGRRRRYYREPEEDAVLMRLEV